MQKTLILLDVDGVLIHAVGYRASVKAVVEYYTSRMGQSHITAPTHADMLAFEAQSIIFEWDSVALCIAALLNQVPELLGDNWEESMNNIAASGIRLQQPDYAALARACPPGTESVKAGRAALGTVFPETPVFIELLGNTHDFDTPITQLFQQFVLGHDQFARTYNVKPLLETESLLEALDMPLLSDDSRERLARMENVQPVIYTARPSLPPGFVMDWRGYAPEAEIAQRLLGLFDAPLIGYGRMDWLARQKGVSTTQFVKPSPVQALAAVYSAALYGTADWEQRALELAVSDAPLPDDIKHAPWRVIVCEDSTGGIRGVRAAVEQIRQQHGMDVSLTAVGVAQAPENVAALGAVADHVTPDVNAGLAWALGW